MRQKSWRENQKRKSSYDTGTKSPDGEDRRRNILHITEEGRKLIAEIFPLNKELVLESLSPLSREEKDALLKLLKKLKRHTA